MRMRCGLAGMAAGVIVGVTVTVTATVAAAMVPAVAATGPRLVGIYSDFTSNAAVSTAVHEGWPLLADVAGLGRADCRAPYTAATGSDRHVAAVLDAYHRQHPRAALPVWESYWTVDAPPRRVSARVAGHAAGRAAATEAVQARGHGAAGARWLVLDPEGYSCGTGGFDRLSTATWRAFVGGWEDGVRSVRGAPTPALYVNQAEYRAKAVAGYHLPVFVAVSPIRGNHPAVHGGNITGYIAYYAQCGNAGPDVRQVRSWGAADSTVQFPNSAICRP